MSGVQRGVTNAFGLPAISAATTDSRRPRYGNPWQLFFNVTDKVIYYDDGTSWQTFLNGSTSVLNFSEGLTQLGANVTNDLITGASLGQIINGFSDDIGGAGLTLKAATTSSINSNFISFYSEIGNYTCFFQNTGAWNFGATSDPILTTPYTYAFQSRGVFNSQWDFATTLKLLQGSHIQSLWQTTAPSGNTSQTHLFFDSVGSPSFRIGTGNWFKFTPNTLTANRNYILRDSNYTLAGTDIDNSFSVAQTFIAGSAGTPSINFGTSNTGIYGNSNQVLISISGSLLATFQSSNLSVNGSISASQIRPTTGTFLNSTINLTNGSGSNTATLTNSPLVGNPTKWIPINDNGITRHIPCW